MIIGAYSGDVTNSWNRFIKDSKDLLNLAVDWGKSAWDFALGQLYLSEWVVDKGLSWIGLDSGLSDPNREATHEDILREKSLNKLVGIAEDAATRGLRRAFGDITGYSPIDETSQAYREGVVIHDIAEAVVETAANIALTIVVPPAGAALWAVRAYRFVQTARSIYHAAQAYERGDYVQAGISAFGAVSAGLNLRAPTGTFFPSAAKLATATTLTKVEAAVFRASELAQAGLLTYQAYEKVQEGKFGEAFISGLQAGFSAYSFMLACFAGEMPVKTPEGSKRADHVQQWDFLLAKNEFDPEGPVEPRLVEEVFVRNGRIFHVHIHDRVIRTTPEHPFYVKGKGWVPAGELEIGDLIGSSDGRWHPVEDLFDTGEYETVYNFRVAEYHTCFVGCEAWGFDVWAHNQYGNRIMSDPEGYAIPYGFSSHAEYRAFAVALRGGLPKGTVPFFQGSAVTGRSFKTGRAFDVGRRSDFDIGIVHDETFIKAMLLGGKAKGNVRIGPIKDEATLQALGLLEVRNQLSTRTGRAVNFMLWDSPQVAQTRSSIWIPEF